jgi:hypothetical protein
MSLRKIHLHLPILPGRLFIDKNLPRLHLILGLHHGTAQYPHTNNTKNTDHTHKEIEANITSPLKTPIPPHSYPIITHPWHFFQTQTKSPSKTGRSTHPLP